MTADIFRNWFLNNFLSEVSPIIDEDMPIQFLVDNCTAHDITLDDLDPDVSVKFLPPNTTSLIQPMDQAVLACVKSHQKKKITTGCFSIVRLTQTNLMLSRIL